MDPWYKVVTPRKEVREGRSFNPDEFAIHLEQVVTGVAPADYRDPDQFFSRTYFTRALTEHAGMVLRRLAGRTENTAPVLTLVTQFGGGKTHTLAALFHLVRAGGKASSFKGVPELLREAGLDGAPNARVAVFAGNAWDPQDGRETPWIDLARQLAGDEGVRILGPSAAESPPGTEALGRVFEAAGGTVLVLFDEVLNFVNRHRKMAEPFHAFIQNLTVAMTATTRGAAVISLPRSQVEMTDWDRQWQEKITKVVRRVAKDLIANDESEISEVVRRRLFDDLGSERKRANVARAYAQWVFERRAQLPPEWTAVDTATTEKKSTDLLQSRFEACYPFHPATLSVFQRKWQALSQYQQTRGTLAMLAQWISVAYRDSYTRARVEPLITLGSAPLDVSGFRSVVLGQLGEPRLQAALDADISGEHAHAVALDADTSGPLLHIHRRTGICVFFESSGGQVDKVAHLPELRFALGGPDLDTTTVDTAAMALEARAFFIRRVGTDGFVVRRQATLKKVVSDRRASLDEQEEVRPEIRRLVRSEFEKGATLHLVPFPAEPTGIPDTPRLSVVVADPDLEWDGSDAVRSRIAEWTRKRGTATRSYPGALVWCMRRPGRELRDKVEQALAWRRVLHEVKQGLLGSEYEKADVAEIQAEVRTAEEAVRDEVWASYRYVLLADAESNGGLKVVDLGAGHSSAAQSLTALIAAALKSAALLNESVSPGYIERHWPPAFADSGAWPLESLRQSFLDGSLTRLVDPDATLKARIVDAVGAGELGFASGTTPDGGFMRTWFREILPPDEVSFEAGVFLLRKARAENLKAPEPPSPAVQPPKANEKAAGETTTEPPPPLILPPSVATLRLSGEIPPELWNRLGSKLVPKLRSGDELRLGLEVSVTLAGDRAAALHREVRQILADLGLDEAVRTSIEG